jgi:hypothetical protein
VVHVALRAAGEREGDRQASYEGDASGVGHCRALSLPTTIGLTARWFGRSGRSRVRATGRRKRGVTRQRYLPIELLFLGQGRIMCLAEGDGPSYGRCRARPPPETTHTHSRNS